MESCNEARPNLDDVSEGIAELNELNMFDFWRDLQEFYISAAKNIGFGLEEPPDTPVDTRYIQSSVEPEMYQLLRLDKTFDGEWYAYTYYTSNSFGKPLDDGEIFYNKLEDATVDKFEIVYKWNGEEFVRDSSFIGNVDAPSNIGDITYIYNTNRSVSKVEQSYVFEKDRFTPFNKTLGTFVPPLDDGSEACDGKKLVVKKYAFSEDSEEWTSQDYVFGYVDGKCGFGGYTATGTSVSNGWTLEGSGSEFYLYNDTMTAGLISDGVIPAHQTGQKITVKMLSSGDFYSEGSFNLGFGHELSILSRNNIIVFSSSSPTDGLVSMDRNGTTGDTMYYLPDYYQVIDGITYKIDEIKIDGSTSVLKLHVDDGSTNTSTGSVDINL